MNRNYIELKSLPTFEERLLYLQDKQKIGEDTFGFDRYLNQKFYSSGEWRRIKKHIIVRDDGCDLAMPDREIPDGVPIIVHHIIPITKDDILQRSDLLLNPDNLICCTDQTHRAIHYGFDILQSEMVVERRKNDTNLWKY